MDTSDQASEPVAAAPASTFATAVAAKAAPSPLARFANAAVAVMTSATYPLAGHIRDELHAAAKALSEFDLPTDVNTAEADASKVVADWLAKMDDYVASLNAHISAAVESTLADIKSAGEAQIAAIKAATPDAKAPNSKGTEPKPPAK